MGKMHLLLLLRDGLEIVVHLPAILRRRLIVRAGREPILRSLRLELFRQRRLDVLERQGCLPPQVLPLGEVLLEGFSPRRGDALARGVFEREPWTRTTGQRRIVTTDLIDQLLGLL